MSESHSSANSDKNSTINSGAGTTPPPPKPPQRHRRRWPMVVGILVLLVLLMILAVPSLLCTGPGVRLLESQINSRISGTVKIGQLSLGWFTPAQIKGVTLRDPNGDVVLGEVNIVTHRSLLNLISNWHNLGKIAIDIKTLHLSRGSSDELNIMQALANPRAPTAPAPPVAPAGAPSNRKTTAAGTPSTLPTINTTLTLTMADASFTAPGLQPLQATQTRIRVAVDTLANKPVELQLDTAAALGKQAPSKIHIAASLRAIKDGQILPAQQITGQLTAGINKLNLAALSPLLSMAGVDLSARGILTLSLSAKIPAPDSGTVTGNLVVEQAALSGALLKGDSPRLGTVKVPMNFSWHANTYQIQSLGAQTGLGNVAISGHGSIATILAILQHRAVPDQLAVVHIKAAASLSHLFGALPHILTPSIDPTLAGGQASLTADMTLGYQPGTSPRDQTGQLPPFSGAMQFDLQPLHWSQVATGASGTTRASGTVAFNTFGRPQQADIHLHISQGSSPPANFALTANLVTIKNGRILPLNQFTGSLNLLVSHLNLAAVSMLISPTGQAIAFQGTVNGRIIVNAPQPGRGSISGPLTITNCALSGTLLKSDRPQLGAVTIPVSVSWHGTRFHVVSTGIQSHNIRMLVSGDISMNQLKAMQNNLPDWGNSGLRMDTYCNLGWLASSFRHALGLNSIGLRLRHGTMNLRADLTSHGKQSAGHELLTLSNLQGTWKKTPFVINPVLVDALFNRRAEHWNLVQGRVDQAASADGKPESTPQLHILVAGKSDGSYTLNLQAVVANLVQEAAPFVPLNGRTASGTLAITGSAADIFSPKIPYHLVVALHQLAVGLGQGQPTITEPMVAINSDGTLLSPHGEITALTSTFGVQTAEIDIPSGKLDLQKTAGGWVVPGVHADIKKIDLAGVMKIARLFSPALAYDDIGGTINHSVIAASYSPKLLDISQLHLVMNQLSFRNTAPNAPTAPFIEPQLTVDLACQVPSGKAAKITISTLALHTSDGAIDLSIAKPILLENGAAMRATIPAFTVSANLAKFQPLLVALGKLKTGSVLRGSLALGGAVESNGPVTTAHISGGVKSYQLVIPGSSVTLPPDDITVSISGAVDTSASTFTCLDNCVMGEHAVTGTGGNSVQLNKGSVVAWSDQSAENINGSVSYDLGRLQSLLGPMLPAGLTMTGEHTMTFHITGQLTADKGLRELRQLRIARTELAFKTISMDGFILGPGEIPFEEAGGVLRLDRSAIPANKGTLNIGGHIDLNASTPKYILSAPLPLLENVQLNGTMGGGLLNFLPLAWGAGNATGGGVQLSGLVNLQLQNADLPLEYAQFKKTGTLTGTVSATHVTSDSPLFAMITHSMGPLVRTGGTGLEMQDSGIRPTVFNLKDGKIYYQNLQVLLATFGMTFSGWVGLDQTLNQDVNVSGAGVTLPIPLTIDGTTSKPQFHLSAKPLKNIGKDIGNTLKNAPNIINNLHSLFGH